MIVSSSATARARCGSVSYTHLDVYKRQGERFDETVTLTLPADLPPGEYPVSVGLYDYATGARLPLTVDGQRQPNDAYALDQLLIVR